MRLAWVGLHRGLTSPAFPCASSESRQAWARTDDRRVMPSDVPVRVIGNGESYERTGEPRLLLSDFLRHELRLTGTHVGCEHGVCGACTVLVDDSLTRACLMLAVQADGARITTVEGLAGADGALHPVQAAFWDTHALQCGFCTSGMLITTLALLREAPHPSEAEIRSALSGNLCRCTGYQNIVAAVRLAAERLEPR